MRQRWNALSRTKKIVVVVVALLVLGAAAGATGGNGKKHGKGSTDPTKLAGETSTTVTLTATATSHTATISATKVSTTAVSAPSMRDAERLAAYQEGVASVSASDPLVPKLNAQLSRLQPDCRESRDVLAGEIWGSWKDLHKNGLNESMLSVFKHVRQSIPRSLAPTNCAQIMAAYLVLRER